MHLSDLHSLLLPVLSYWCLCCISCFQLNIYPRHYNCKIFGLILLLFFNLTSYLHQVSVAERSAQQIADSKVAYSNLCRIFHVTPRCLLVTNSDGPVAEKSTLSFSSPELLAQALGCRFESCQWILVLTFNFILSKQIVFFFFSPFFPTYVHMHSCSTVVKSAVLPKTTSLCGSVTVITLCVGHTPVRVTASVS